MKNSRGVCAAEHAGYVEYAGLPRRVKTGCMDTPEQRSKYCSQHRSRQAECSDGDQHHPQDIVVETILSKKTTRTNTFFQVRMPYTCSIKGISQFCLDLC